MNFINGLVVPLSGKGSTLLHLTADINFFSLFWITLEFIYDILI